MKFKYYAKKKSDDIRFFTIQTNNDEEMMKIETLSVYFGINFIPEASGKYGFEYCYAVIDDSITNISQARERYNQIKQAVNDMKESEIIQRYYFTDDDGNEVWECQATPDEAYEKAQELANQHGQTIRINTVIGEEIVDCAFPDDIATIETTEPRPDCETEIVKFKADKNSGYGVVCTLLMLCSPCHDGNNIGYDTATDSCRFDSS